jgi:nicotinamide mononucleotide (NMN) deamidase PncC
MSLLTYDNETKLLGVTPPEMNAFDRVRTPVVVPMHPDEQLPLKTKTMLALAISVDATSRKSVVAACLNLAE